MLNRSFLIVKPKQAFLDWAKSVDPEFDFIEADDLEGNCYLIEEDFFEIEPILEKNFKQILKNEFFALTEEESLWPEKRTLDLFLTWFEFDFGSVVLDLEKNNLTSDDVEI